MTNATHIRILGVDDHPVLDEGIAAIIMSQPDMELGWQATSGNDAIFNQFTTSIVVF